MKPKKHERKTRIVGKIVLFFILTSFIWSLLRSIFWAVRDGKWALLVYLFFTLLLFGLIAYRWVRSILASREEYRRRVLERAEQVRLRDALLYGLSFSKEIYTNIPPDRRRLVKYSFILIALPFAFMIWQSAGHSISSYLFYILLALAGFNLLVWVVASEREEKERLKIELETARQMQLSLMPRQAPRISGVDIAGLCIPARSVGGDHYDFVWLGEEKKRLGVAVVDVSGKGVDAALTAVYTSGAFVSETQHESEAACVLRNLNLALRSRRNPRHFVSFFFLVLEPAQRRLQYVNAGQCRPLLFRGGQVTALLGAGPRFPLGVRPGVEYVPTDLELLPGDHLLLYTDGVSDAMNPESEVFGSGRLQLIFGQSAAAGRTAQETVHAVHQAVLEYAAGAEQYDDITLVSLRVTATP